MKKFTLLLASVLLVSCTNASSRSTDAVWSDALALRDELNVAVTEAEQAFEAIPPAERVGRPFRAFRVIQALHQVLVQGMDQAEIDPKTRLPAILTLETLNRGAVDVMGLLFVVMKESFFQMTEDKKYFLEKLNKMNEMAKKLRDSLDELKRNALDLGAVEPTGSRAVVAQVNHFASAEVSSATPALVLRSAVSEQIEVLLECDPDYVASPPQVVVANLNAGLAYEVRVQYDSGTSHLTASVEAGDSVGIYVSANDAFFFPCDLTVSYHAPESDLTQLSPQDTSDLSDSMATLEALKLDLEVAFESAIAGADTAEQRAFWRDLYAWSQISANAATGLFRTDPNGADGGGDTYRVAHPETRAMVDRQNDLMHLALQDLLSQRPEPIGTITAITKSQHETLIEIIRN